MLTEPTRISKEEWTYSKMFSPVLDVGPFDWNAGKFKNISNQEIILVLSGQLLACFFFIIFPCLIYNCGWIEAPYALLHEYAPDNSRLGMEVIRWTLTIGLALFGYVLMNTAILSMTFCIFFYFRESKEKVYGKLRHLMDHTIVLRSHANSWMASLFLFIASLYLFSLTQAEANEMKKIQGVVDYIPQISLEKTAAMMSNIAIGQGFRHYGESHSTNFFVKSLIATVFVGTSLIFLEKILVQKISSIFYYGSFAQRIKNNSFAVKATERLREYIKGHRPDWDGMQTDVLIFRGLNRAGASVITVADVAEHMGLADAETYFDLLDLDNTKELNQAQVTRALKFFYEEQDGLRAAMLDQQKIIGKLDRLFMFFIATFIFVICMAIFHVSIQTILAALGGLGGFLFFMSEGALKTAFESIIYVIFTHPFDVGDHVVIKGEGHTVKELGLWACTFEGPGNRITYISNARLRSEAIINTRRSPAQAETIRINILPTTSNEKLQQLEANLLEFVKKNHRDYMPKLAFPNVSIIDQETMRLDIQLTHRGNFQDTELKNKRTTSFILYLKETMQQMDIKVSPPKWREIN